LGASTGVRSWQSPSGQDRRAPSSACRVPDGLGLSRLSSPPPLHSLLLSRPIEPQSFVPSRIALDSALPITALHGAVPMSHSGSFRHPPLRRSTDSGRQLLSPFHLPSSRRRRFLVRPSASRLRARGAGLKPPGRRLARRSAVQSCRPAAKWPPPLSALPAARRPYGELI
jgi:hypothetical protein